MTRTKKWFQVVTEGAMVERYSHLSGACTAADVHRESGQQARIEHHTHTVEVIA